MFAENEKISVRQLKRNQMLLLLSMGILFVPLYGTGEDLSTMVTAILLLDGYLLWSMSVEAPEELSWLRIPGRVLFWVVGTMTARMTGILIRSFLLTETELAVILGWFYLFLFYNLYRGLECRMRVSEILFWFCILFLVFLPVLMWGSIDLTRLKDVQWHWGKGQLRDGYGLFCYLAVIQGLWYLKPYVALHAQKDWKKTGRFCALITSMLILLCSGICWCIYGTAGQEGLLYPLASAMTLAHFPGNVIGRLDTVFVLGWVTGLFLACSTLFAPLSGSKRNKWKNTALAIALLGSYFLSLQPSVLTWGDRGLRWILIPLQVMVLLWQTWKKYKSTRISGTLERCSVGTRKAGVRMLLLIGLAGIAVCCTACGKQELEMQSLVESLAIDEENEISFIFAEAENEDGNDMKSTHEQSMETDTDHIFTTKAASIHAAMENYGEYHQKKLNLNHLQYLYLSKEILLSEQLPVILKELQTDERFSRGILIYITEGSAKEEALGEEKPEEGTPVHKLLNAWYNQESCVLPLVSKTHQYKNTILWQYSDQ